MLRLRGSKRALPHQQNLQD